MKKEILCLMLCTSGYAAHASGLRTVPKEVPAASPSGVSQRLRTFMDHIETFNTVFPQEKVYLHFDNTGYFAGETIWFKAYVTRTDRGNATDISRVLYVELIHSEGEIIETCKLRVENGLVHILNEEGRNEDGTV